MSDNNIKILPPKEPTTPKKTVILKSDREPVKVEPEKEEKEKQPTIMVMMREQSASKDDRPISPKLELDMKDRKEIEFKLLTHAKQMAKPLKLLDENYEFNNSVLEYLDDSSTEFLVISVIGGQAVGKSTILNLIANYGDFTTIQDEILAACDVTEEISEDTSEDTSEAVNEAVNEMVNGVDDDELEDLGFGEGSSTPSESSVLSEEEIVEKFVKFKLQNLDNLINGNHTTKGIDVYVTKDRVILLDCQPIWSASLFEATSSPVSLMSRNTNVMTTGLQLTAFLMSVSHVIVGVQDWFTDFSFLRFMQTAEMLRPSLAPPPSPDPESSEPTPTEHNPHLVLVHNRCTMDDFAVDDVSAANELYRKALQHSSMMIESGVYQESDENLYKYDEESCGKRINLCLLPETVPDDGHGDSETIRKMFEKLSLRFRQQVLGVTRNPISSGGILSEKAWYHYASRAWDTTRKCTFFIEYERLLS